MRVRVRRVKWQPPTERPRRGPSIGWVFAGMAWSSVFHEPLWVGALSGALVSLVFACLFRNASGCVGCAASGFWAWPIALLGGIVWLARAV